MSKYLTLLIALLINQHLLAQVPAVTGFSPSSGPIGTIVTINGSNFSLTAANNFVFFGAVRANVITSTTNSIEVIVPGGATYQPITVTVNTLTASSIRPFLVTFPGGGNGFSATSFASKNDYTSGKGPACIASADFDGDGKPDLVAVNDTSNTFSVFRNISTTGVIALSAKSDFITGNKPYSVSAGDLDGDGKPDIVVANAAGNTVSIFRNISTGVGDISFTSKTDLPSAAFPFCVAICDFDGDGKQDLASTSSNNVVSIFKNNSTTGSFSFSSKIDFATGVSPFWIATGDLDGDGKPDLATANGTDFNWVSVLRNTSTPGNISFASKVDFNGGTYGYSIMMGDINDDGKPDLTVAGENGNSILVMLNNSTGIGNISFGQNSYFSAGGASYGVALADMDGDGKPDIVAANSSLNSISVLKNRSQLNYITFDQRKNYLVGTNPWVPVVVDLDGDGKPDIATANERSANISVLKNTVSDISIQSFSPTAAGKGITVTITGYGFIGITGVSFGGVPADSFMVQSSTVITAIVGNGASGNLAIIRNADSILLAGFTHLPSPVITSISNNIGGTGDSITIVGTNFINITDVSFGGIPASSFAVQSPTQLIAVVGPGASGNIIISSNGGTGSFGGFTYFPPPAITSFTPANADTGSVVTITGNNFTGTTSVKFGGLNAKSFNIVSSNIITAIVGAFSGGEVSVTTPYGKAKLPGFYNGISITSFTPLSGPIGTVVTISGANFDNDPLKNIVFFGAARATVISANNHTLTVLVPAGTTYQPISIACHQMVAFTDQPFIQTFVNSDTVFTTNSFAAKVDFQTPQNPYGIAVSDLDGDGRVEVIVSSSTEVSVFKNTSSKGNISFFKIDFPLAGTLNVTVCDMTGDGLPDIVTSNNSGTISVIRNGSNIGFLTLLAPIEFAMGSSSYYHVAFNDIDGDGKADLTATDEDNNKILIYRNTTVNNILSFGAVISYPGGVQPQATYLGDLDGDLKAELVVSTSNSGKLYIYKNLSTSGNILFDSPYFIASPYGLGTVLISDMDGDNKQDIVISNKMDTSILIFRNLSTLNNISFAPYKRFLAGINIYDMCIQDLDGDGKPDIAGVSIISNTICLLKNKSVVGNISMHDKVEYITGKEPTGIAIADFDGDGKPDLVVADFRSDSISFHRNTMGEISSINLCPPIANTIISSDIAGVNFKWQVDVGTGFTDISNNSNYSGATTDIIQLSNIPSSWYGYKYRCVSGVTISRVFQLQFLNAWTGSVNSDWTNASNWNCGAVPDNNTDVVINSGTIVINSNVTIRSLIVSPGASITVNTGFNLTVLH